MDRPLTEQAKTVVVFEDAVVRVVYRPGQTPFTLVTFSQIDFWRTPQLFWAEGLCLAKDINAIGFVAKQNNWFPPASMRPALAAVARYLSGPVATFGYSQGGYAALKYASALGASGVISACPQYSINPARAPIKPGYRHIYSAALHGDMEITQADQSGRIVLLYDPGNGHDAEHVRLVLAQGHLPTELIHLHYLQHRLVDVLSDYNVVFDLIEACLQADDLCSIRLRMRGIKKRSVTYRINLARAMLKRGSAPQALRLLETITENSRGMYDLARDLLNKTLLEARQAARTDN